eukprot:4984356-Pyramimonas_sp.AAC.1
MRILVLSWLLGSPVASAWGATVAGAWGATVASAWGATVASAWVESASWPAPWRLKTKQQITFY